MNMKPLAAGTMALAVVFAAAACSGSATDTPAPSVTTSAVEEVAAHNRADVMFARMMIPHHTQAIEMSDMLLAKEGIPDQVTALAEQIKAAQGPEIDEMNSWLEQWDDPQMPNGMPGTGHMPEMTSMPGMGRGMPDNDDMPDMGGMGGMMSAQDMQALADAQGIEATRLFLTQMIAHHEGAIEMAETELRQGKYPDTIALARTIAVTQQREIDTMRQLLTTL